MECPVFAVFRVLVRVLRVFYISEYTNALFGQRIRLTNRKLDRMLHKNDHPESGQRERGASDMKAGTALPLRDCARRLGGIEFGAPVLADGLVRLRRFGHTFMLRIAAALPGWWICRALDPRRAAIVAEAPAWVRNEYLAARPSVPLVLLAPTPAGGWLALPRTATSRDQVSPFPTIVYLVEGGHPFAAILARTDGGTLWFDDHDRRADPTQAEELREALEIGLEAPHIDVDPATAVAFEMLRRDRLALESGQGLTLWETLLAHQAETERQRFREWRRALLKEQQFEKRLRRALAHGGAALVAMTVTRGGYQVTWQRHDRRGITIVDEDLTVASAGFCLSGRDRDFDMTSIIDVALR